MLIQARYQYQYTRELKKDSEPGVRSETKIKRVKQSRKKIKTEKKKFEANRSDKNEGENVPCHEIQYGRQPWRKTIRPPVVAESNETTGRGGIH